MNETIPDKHLTDRVEKPRLHSRGNGFVARSVCGGSSEVFNAVINHRE